MDTNDTTATSEGNSIIEQEKPPDIQSPLLKSAVVDWDELNNEFNQLQEDHDAYKKKLEETKILQKKCLSGIAHQRYRMKKINESLMGVPDPTSSDRGHISELQTKMVKRKNAFRDLEDHLPHKNGRFDGDVTILFTGLCVLVGELLPFVRIVAVLYLSIILGHVNISLLNKEDKYLYKQDYEKFKLTLSYIIFFLSLVLVGSNYIVSGTSGIRWMDAVLHFLLVWYYCTLTIREQILIVNGSRIKGWWLIHHFVSTVCSAITLIWPDGWSYWQFRTQYGWFIFYVAFVQVLQYYYQRGCLYRLKALGHRHDMDITVEGFMSWMFKGLAFLLPFLFVAYFFQLYNAVVLYWLTYEPKCTEWQVPVLCVIHLVLFLGNMTTVLGVLKQKFSNDFKYMRKVYKNKYRFNNVKPKTM